MIYFAAILLIINTFAIGVMAGRKDMDFGWLSFNLLVVLIAGFALYMHIGALGCNS